MECNLTDVLGVVGEAVREIDISERRRPVDLAEKL
jgi:hypothetical protein